MKFLNKPVATDLPQPDSSSAFRLSGRFAYLQNLLIQTCTALSWLELRSDCLRFKLPKQPASELRYCHIASIEVNSWHLWGTISITSREGARYLLLSFTKSDLEYVHRALSAHLQLADLRTNWDVVLKAYEHFMALYNQQRYLTNSQLRKWQGAHQLPKLPNPDLAPRGVLTDLERTILTILREPRHAIVKRNKDFVEQELDKWASFFDTVENNPLTEQQKLAVVQDEDNTLVLAGAGTGKTSTIIAKVGYLLKSGLAAPDEILLLAFTRKSAEEMKERIAEKIGADVQVRTFHSLGLEILTQAEQRKPSLSKDAGDQQALKATLEKLLEGLVFNDTQLCYAYRNFVTSNLVPYRSPFEFTTEGEYMVYLKESGMRSLSGEMLRSYEEIEIANWLYLNGVAYEYERPYEVDTATIDHRQYKPDFYYPEYQLYHEHFGINRDGDTAPFVDREKYHADMKWKRDLHSENGTALIETYSWMKQDGELLSHLERELTTRGVKLNPVAPKQVLERFREANYVNPVLDLLSSFLNLYKGSDMAEAEVLEKASRSKHYTRNQTFLKIFLPLLHAYEEKHESSNEIDFDDMIRKALDYAGSGQYKSRFRYLLVDEFQDISQSRARLIRSLREQIDDSKLFCVGDDWQAIYRFAGSDLSLVTNFSQFFGFSKTVALDRTFRFNNKIVDFSSEFIRKNDAQLRKTLTPNNSINIPAVELIMAGRREEPYTAILEAIVAQNAASSVFFLGRYNFTIPKPSELEFFREQFPSLAIDAMTVHKSKGLEADYAIVCKLVAGKHGFPSEIADDPVLDLVLVKPDQYPHSEERRLFYVAVTRARKKVYLIGDKLNPSCFVDEIKDDPAYNAVEFGTHGTYDDANCPTCAAGILVPRDGRKRQFAGCSNYPLCTYTQELCKKCGEGIHMASADQPNVKVCNVCHDTIELCPRCGIGTLEPKKGPYSLFLGCSMFRSDLNCRYTRTLAKNPAQRDLF